MRPHLRVSAPTTIFPYGDKDYSAEATYVSGMLRGADARAKSVLESAPARASRLSASLPGVSNHRC